MTVLGAGKAAPWSVTCGVCRRAAPRGSPDPQDVREGARREGWRFTNAFGWCCATCALGAPGLYVAEENERRIRRRKVSRRELAADRAQDAPHDPENAEIPARRPGTRGFGWNTLGEILEGLNLKPEDPEEP